jgi:signal peptidase II
LLPVAALVAISDQLSKTWIRQNVPLNEVFVPIPALGNILWFQHVTNTGAAFGLFRGGGTVLMAIGVVVILTIIVYTRFLPTERRLVQLCLGLQLGGAIGNLADRLRFGSVVDFIKVPYWPNFNIADSSLVVGAILLALLVLTEKEEVATRETASGL